MKRIEKEKVRLILIEFSKLAGVERREFLGAMNEFLFSSPQRRRHIVAGWETQKPSAPVDHHAGTQQSSGRRV
ncbi:hypothetical protein [Burkholderia multivorans]|uniref:hypothetical protein n=1 Tax=Burkholderia multivorans TaxID=87883 RepID=UPI000D00E47C|nr:hypothetical protein [Burkholderia multivorans]MBN6732905.1 hypothetical protein [Burkholderia multivorans]MBN6738447.1 hypothetical protein [Burkholderia multivorans]MBN7125146.1 hypothetical protein [Burkholderia multivorans]MBN8167208.1 hypothetical protein [Burkholderia multivorans]MBN8173001.1 hypothetical protein [Burkholderia multivorans]